MRTVKQVCGAGAQRPLPPVWRAPAAPLSREPRRRSGRGAGCVLASPAAPAVRGKDARLRAAGARGPRSAARPWLPDAAALLRVHVGALGAVEGFREGRQVLQRAQHPEGDRGPEPASLGARARGGGLPAGRGGYLPVLQGAVHVGLDGLYGKLGPVGPAPHLWAQEGCGCGPGAMGRGSKGALRGSRRSWGGPVVSFLSRHGGVPPVPGCPFSGAGKGAPAPSEPSGSDPRPSFSSRNLSRLVSSGSAWLARCPHPWKHPIVEALRLVPGHGGRPAGDWGCCYLRVVDEEQLGVAEFQSWQLPVLAAFCHPLQVSLQVPDRSWAQACLRSRGHTSP